MNSNHMQDDDLDMNATISNDGKEFSLLKEGDYRFTVADFEQAEFMETTSEGQKKRKRIILTIQVIDGDGYEHELRDWMTLKKTMEWRFCQLFKSIGDRKQGEPLRMDWANIRGKKGYVRIKHEEYEKNGIKKLSAKVKEYLEPKDSKTTLPKPTYTQPSQQRFEPSDDDVAF